MDYKEYARQMRENAVIDDYGRIICSPELWEQLARVIESQPTADVEEVVRCSECKYWKCKRKGILDDYIGDCLNENHYSRSEYAPIMRETDFCSYGERKENE